MKTIGYGYQRAEADLTEVGAEVVYIDTAKTDRMERRDMLKMALRRGDILVLRKAGDLGAAGELAHLRKLIADLGATVEVRKPPKPTARRVGAPRKFDPASDVDARLQAMWHDLTLAGPYVLRRAKEIGGDHVRRHHLQQRYGNRSGKRRVLSDNKEPES